MRKLLKFLTKLMKLGIELKRKTRTQEPSQPEEDGKNRQMIQIFVKMDGSMMFQLMVSPSDKVDDGHETDSEQRKV